MKNESEEMLDSRRETKLPDELPIPHTIAINFQTTVIGRLDRELTVFRPPPNSFITTTRDPTGMNTRNFVDNIPRENNSKLVEIVYIIH